MTTLEFILAGITLLAGLTLAWVLFVLPRTQPPPPPDPVPFADDRPSMTEFTAALDALARSQAAALHVIADESKAGRAHVEAIVTQLTGPPAPASPESVTELEPDTQLEGPMREASDEWITDDAMVDPFAPPAGLPLPPMPGVMPPDDL